MSRWSSFWLPSTPAMTGNRLTSFPPAPSQPTRSRFGITMPPKTTRFEVRNLVRIRAAVDQHNHKCPEPVRSICLNPIDHGLLGHDELWGIPVFAVDEVPVKRFRLDCSGSAELIEAELANYLDDKSS